MGLDPYSIETWDAGFDSRRRRHFASMQSRTWNPMNEESLLQEFANDFRVSTEVIGLQLCNAGVWRDIED